MVDFEEFELPGWAIVGIALVLACIVAAALLLTDSPDRPSPNQVCAGHGGVETLEDIDGNNGWVICRDGFAGETEALG